MILSIICTIITYPGIFYSDSYVRLEFSNEIIDALKEIMLGNRSDINMESWLTVVPSFFIAICKLITGNIAFYTVMQSFMFFLSAFFLAKKLGNHFLIFQYIFLAINPIIYCVSIYYEASIGCVTGIVFLILLLDSIKVSKSIIDKVLEFLLLMFFSFIIFGYRANAFTIIPVLFIYIIKTKIDIIKKILVIVPIVCGILFINILTQVLNINTMSSMSAGFAWEIISVIQNMDLKNQNRYSKYLDDVGKDGATLIELEKSDTLTVNGLLANEGININNISKKENSKKIIKKYIYIIIHEPMDYIKLKLNFISRTLGISERLRCVEYDYNRWDKMSDYNFNDSVKRQNFVNIYNDINKVFGFFTCRPWIVFFVSILLVVIKWNRNDLNKNFCLLILMVSLFYYGSYLINTQSFELRYFYPSLYLCIIMDLSIASDLVYDILLKKK